MSGPAQPLFCIVDTGPCFLASRSKALVQTLNSFERCFGCHAQNLLQQATKDWDQGCRKFMSCYFLAHRSKTFVPTLKKSFESCFARQAPNLPTTVTCHRRLVLLMAERQKKPRLIQRHFSGSGFIMNGFVECRATDKTIFTTTITLAIIQPSHQYFCEPQP